MAESSAVQRFSRYLQEGEAEFDFLPPAAVDDHLKFLDQDIRQKENAMERAVKSLDENEQRVKSMREHLKNVQLELENTRSLLDAKNREIETEEHIKLLAEREGGRMLQDIRKQEKEYADLQDRLNALHNSIFQGNEKMDKFKMEMHWNQSELEQWVLASKQKEEDNLVVQKYARMDEAKIRELTNISDKLQRQLTAAKTSLESEVTNTQAAQIELDKTAQDFKVLHQERQDLVTQWEAAVESMKRRNLSIEEAGRKLEDITELVSQKQDQLKEKQDFFKLTQEENALADRQLVDAERSLQKFRATLTERRELLGNLKDELDIVKSSLTKTNSSLQMRRIEVQNASAVLEEKKAKLEMLRRKQADTKRRLEMEMTMTSDLEHRANAAEMLHRQELAQLKDTDRQLQEVKTEMFRKSQELFDLRRQEANFISEISGAHSSDRNLRDKIKQLDAQSQKQQELLYAADFQLQQMERKVSRAQGEYRADEKEKFTKQITILETQLKETQDVEKMLSRQLTKVQDDVRSAQRSVVKMSEEKTDIENRLQELNLENDSVSRALKASLKKKEEAVVQHDLMRLEVKKLKETLNTRADQVFGLENRKFQLQKSLEQRMQEIAIQRAALVADLKLADDDRHRLVIENKEREIKVQTLQTRCTCAHTRSLTNRLKVYKTASMTEVMLFFQVRPARVSHVQPTGRHRRPQEPRVLHRHACTGARGWSVAPHRAPPVHLKHLRQELQRFGDEKELSVKKTEREIRALRSTLERLNSKNQRFKQSFTKVEGDSEDLAEMEQLQPVLEAVSDRRRQARTEVEHLSGDVASMQGSLGNLMQETASIDRQVQGLRKRVDGVQVCVSAATCPAFPLI
jgi:chromosome segregation ATPase